MPRRAIALDGLPSFAEQPPQPPRPRLPAAKPSSHVLCRCGMPASLHHSHDVAKWHESWVSQLHEKRQATPCDQFTLMAGMLITCECGHHKDEHQRVVS